MENPTYFVTTCVDKRKPILACEEVREIFIEEWSTAFDRYSWAIGRYVIMPDHVHFFCSSLEQKKSLDIYIGKWKEWACKLIRKRTSLNDFRWQNGFFDHLMRNKESRSEKWDYVRNNPVRAGLVDKPEDWPYQGFVDFE